jgi:hypothetical protein
MKSSFFFVYKLNRRWVQDKYVARIVKKETTTQLKVAQGFCKTYYNFAIELWIYGLILWLILWRTYFGRLGKINVKSFIWNVLPLIISLGESDSEFDWNFDAGNDDSEFTNEIMEVE